MSSITVTVELPETLGEFVNERVTDSGYRDVGQYVLDLIRADEQVRRELAPYTSGQRVEELLREGLASGIREPKTAEDWERLKRPYLAPQHSRACCEQGR